MRAIEDVNELCTNECTDQSGDGAGRCRQHDNTNGLDVCWAHAIHNRTGAEYCPPGGGVLSFEAIPAFLCPDSALEGILGVAVDTTVPNIPYAESTFSAAAEPTSTSSTTSNWLRLRGKERRSEVPWAEWRRGQQDGKRCREHASFGWSAAKLGALTLREAVELCTANYPHNWWAGVVWGVGGRGGEV